MKPLRQNAATFLRLVCSSEEVFKGCPVLLCKMQMCVQILDVFRFSLFWLKNRENLGIGTTVSHTVYRNVQSSPKHWKLLLCVQYSLLDRYNMHRKSLVWTLCFDTRKKSEGCIHLAPLCCGRHYPVAPFLPPQPLHVDLFLHLQKNMCKRELTYGWRKRQEHISVMKNCIYNCADFQHLILLY